MAVSLTVYEIFSVKELVRGCSRSLKMAGRSIHYIRLSIGPLL